MVYPLSINKRPHALLDDLLKNILLYLSRGAHSTELRLAVNPILHLFVIIFSTQQSQPKPVTALFQTQHPQLFTLDTALNPSEARIL